MTLPEDLLCVFTARITEHAGRYVIEIPDREISLGAIDQGSIHRIGVFKSAPSADRDRITAHQTAVEGRTHGPTPPVEEGATREVEIEDIGEQGDGLARVERGYILFVPDTEVGDRVSVEVTQVRENFAFGDVVDGPY